MALNWKDLKKAAKIDPERAAELRRGAQRGVEQGRAGLAKRLVGPAAHLRNVGSQFKAGLGETEVTESGQPQTPPDASGPTSTADPAGTDA